MEEKDLEEWGEQLAEQVAIELQTGRSKKWRCSRGLRSRIVTYAQRCRENGEVYGDIAARLGLVESTLARWLRREKAIGRASFRSVAIVPSTENHSYSEATSIIRLITPQGYRIEGLDAETVAYLLRVIG